MLAIGIGLGLPWVQQIGGGGAPPVTNRLLADNATDRLLADDGVTFLTKD